MDFEALKNFLARFVDTSKLGGYVRAGAAALLVDLVGQVPGLSDILTQQEIGYISLAVATGVVGVWSHFVKAKADK